MTQTKTIKIYDERHYLGFVALPAEGISALTHLAYVKDPTTNTQQRAYLKLFTEPDKQFVNEVTGYLLAAHAGVTQPSRGFVQHVPITVLQSLYPRLKFPVNRSTLPLWGTSDLGAGTAKHYFHTVTPALIKDLQGWDKLPTAMAFDEWVANIDRNIGNLVRLAAGQYAVIDHGHVLTSPDWKAGHLISGKSYPNKLEQIAWPNGVTLPAKSAAMHALTHHERSLTSAWLELQDWWKTLLSPEDMQCAGDFLTNRLRDCPSLMRQRLQVI